MKGLVMICVGLVKAAVCRPDCKVFTITAAGRLLTRQCALVDEESDTDRFVGQAECGLCVEPEGPDALAEAIPTLYSDPDLRERLGRDGRQLVEEKYTGERSVALLEEVYQRVIEREVLAR